MSDANLEEELLLARELSRDVDIPEIAGFETHCHALKCNLWWRDGRSAVREFSDIVSLGEGKFALIAARVHDSVDGSGAALALRAYLRAGLQKARGLRQAISDVFALARQDNQWALLATLAVCTT